MRPLLFMDFTICCIQAISPLLLGGTPAIISQLAPKAASGSYSRDARIRQSYTGLPDTLGTAATGKDARLANAQEAYAKALARKDAEQFSYPEFQEPEEIGEVKDEETPPSPEEFIG